MDRAPNPWSDIPLADVVWVAGSNVAETFPITTSYIWRARDRGAKLIVQDPRVVPLARTADLFLPRAAGHRLGAVRRGAARADPPRLARPRVHRRPHRRLRRGRRGRRRHDPAWAAGITGVPAARIEQAAEWWGTSATGMLLHARGIEQHSKGVENVLGGHQPRSGHRQVRQAGLRRVHHHRAGQRPGRARARPQVRPAARQPRHHQPRAPGRTSRRCGGATSPRSRARDLSAEEIIEAIHDGHDQGPAVDLLQPGGVGARRRSSPRRRSTGSSSSR